MSKPGASLNFDASDKSLPPAPSALSELQWAHYQQETRPENIQGLKAWYQQMWKDYADIENKEEVGRALVHNIQQTYSKQFTPMQQAQNNPNTIDSPIIAKCDPNSPRFK